MSSYKQHMDYLDSSRGESKQMNAVAFESMRRIVHDKLPDFVDGIDWKLLKDQRSHLRDVMDDYRFLIKQGMEDEKEMRKEFLASLEGINNLLESLSDINYHAAERFDVHGFKV